MSKRKKIPKDGYCSGCGQYFKCLAQHLNKTGNSCNAIVTDKTIVCNQFSSVSSKNDNKNHKNNESKIHSKLDKVFLGESSLDDSQYRLIASMDTFNSGILNYQNTLE